MNDKIVYAFMNIYFMFIALAGFDFIKLLLLGIQIKKSKC